jgi:hypothetical protein
VVERANSRTRKMQILQFTLLASDLVWRGRTPFFAINSNRFGRPWEVELDYSYDDVKDIRKKTENGPSRKIFRQYLPELLKERLLTRIITKDNKSKYYSITPLGIIHLIKSEMFYDGVRYPHPERNYVLLRLETFAEQKVKPYKSNIFENEKFFNSNIDLLGDIHKARLVSLREEIVHVFSNVDITQEYMNTEYEWNHMEYFVTNGYPDANRIRLASFDLKNKDYVKITEIDQLPSMRGDDPEDEKNALILDSEQFHHYLANLMLCSLIYDSAMAHYDIDRYRKSRTGGKKELTKTMDDEFKEDLKNIPEYFLRILFLFSKHILRITQDQYQLTSRFSDNLTKIQFVKTN